MFAAEHFGIKPDIFTAAKGIASGFLLSAIIAKKEIMEQWAPGAHGGTFGGNPVACAAAPAAVTKEEIDMALLTVRESLLELQK